MYNIVFMGTPDLGVPALEALINDDRFHVQLVITQPDKPVGRKQVLTSPPIKVIAEQYNVQVLQPEKLRTKGNKELLRTLAPDFIVVIAYGKILPKSILDIPKYACVNAHVSILPKYRGSSPIPAALLHGDSETGVTTMLMNEGMDEGDILQIDTIPLTKEDTSASVFHKLSVLTASVLPDVLDRYAKGNITPQPQDHSKATFCGKIEKADGEIRWQEETAQSIYHKWQAYTPWPGIFSFIKNKRLKLLKIDYSTEKSLPAGHVEITTGGNVFVGAKEEALELLEVQLEGKKPMKIQEFLQGNSLENLL